MVIKRTIFLPMLFMAGSLFLSALNYAQVCAIPPKDGELIGYPGHQYTATKDNFIGTSANSTCYTKAEGIKALQNTRYYNVKRYFGDNDIFNQVQRVSEFCDPNRLYIVFTEINWSTVNETGPMDCQGKYKLYCDKSSEEPCTPTNTSSVSSPDSDNCGNGSLDPNEECDLGNELNNDTEAGSFGCKKNCTKHTGWSCSKDMAEYKQKEQEANTLYSTLVIYQNEFSANNCSSYYAGDPAKELSCHDYQRKLLNFKQANGTIKVKCDNITNLKERPSKNGQAQPADYTVKCS